MATDNMNIAFLLQPGETGIDPEWYKRDDPPVMVAADIVQESPENTNG